MKIKEVLTITTGVLETTCTSGLVYGWSSMNYILTEEGYFESGCNSSRSNSSSGNVCLSQQYNLELVFTLSLIISCVMTPFSGAILDRFGTLVSRNLNALLYAISCVAIAYSNPEISWIIYPSVITLGITGTLFFIANLQIANLFPRFRGTIINILTGAATAGMAIFTLAKVAYEHGFGIRSIFLFMLFLAVPIVLRTYFLMPKRIIPYQLSSNFYYGIKESACILGNDKTSERDRLFEDNRDVNRLASLKETELKSCIINSLFLLGAFSFAIQWLRIDFFIAEVNVWLKFLIPNDSNLVSRYISLFGFLQLIGLILAPLNGSVFDLLYRYYDHTEKYTSAQARLKSLAVISFIATSVSILYSLFAIIPSSKLQIATFLLVVLSNVSTSASTALLLIHCFPMRYFGTLFGLAFFASAIAVSALQFPLYYVALHYFEGNFFVPNLVMLVLAATTLLHPFNLYRKSKFNVELYAGT